MEAERKQIALKGIQRDVSPVGADEGSCSEMTNLRMKDGALRPVLPKEILHHAQGYPQVKELFAHTVLPDGEYLVRWHEVNPDGDLEGSLRHVRIDPDNTMVVLKVLATWFAVEAGGFDYDFNITFGYEDQDDYMSVGILSSMVVCSTREKTTYHLYRNGQYLVNEALNELPDIMLGVKAEEHTWESGPSTLSSWRTPKGGSYGEVLNRYYEYLKEKEEENLYSGAYVFIAAYRLTDGTVIKHSQPFYHLGFEVPVTPQLRYWPGKILEIHDPIGGDGPHIIEWSRYHEYQIIKVKVAQMRYKLQMAIDPGWTNVISSIDIYVARLPKYTVCDEPERSHLHHELPDEMEEYDFNIAGIDEGFKNAIFRKIDSVAVPDDGQIDHEDTANLSNLGTKEALAPDQLSHHDIGYGTTFTYNGRLHGGNTLTQLSLGHDLYIPHMDWLQTSYVEKTLMNYTIGAIGDFLELVDANYTAFGQYGQPIFRVFVKTQDGDYVVNHPLPTSAIVVKGLYSPDRYFLILPKIISYPHPKATRFQVVMPITEHMGALVFEGELVKHEMYSFAYHTTSPENERHEIFVVTHGEQLEPDVGTYVWDIVVSFFIPDTSQHATFDFALTPVVGGPASPATVTWVKDKDTNILDSFEAWVNGGGLTGQNVTVESMNNPAAVTGLLIVVFRPTTDYNLELYQGTLVNAQMGSNYDYDSAVSDALPLSHNRRRIYQPNRLQLTAIENPLVWPAINSYVIGEDKRNTIRDLAVQATPTSEGQFGEYPLIVFGENGIYAVNQGSGDVVYGSVVHISRLQANPGVLGVDGVIMFSTTNGLFLLAGRQTQELNRFLIANTLYDVTWDENIPANQLPHADRSSDALTFIQNPVFGWDDQHREIVIASSAFGYHYRWNPQQGVMASADGCFEGFVIKGGQYLGYLNKERDIAGGGSALCLDVHSMAKDVSDVDYVPIYFKTNPQHLGYMDLKKLMRTQFYLDIPRADPAVFRFYIYGGNIIQEAVPFILTQYIELPTDTHAVHLIAGRTPLSARYFVFTAFGPVDKDSVFHHITTDVKPVLPGKMR